MLAPKPKILVIETGGTIAQKPDKSGVLRPTRESVTRWLCDRFPEVERNYSLKIDRLSPPVDSTNMRHEHRRLIAQKIHDSAWAHDGFVVVHGTDTMAETAAALTFMVQGLGKPIILTGSQLPIYHLRTDGINNLLAAIESASHDYGEVAIAFGEGLFRGPRTIKYDERSFNAFKSPRAPLIGHIGIRVEPSPYRITRGEARKELRLFCDFDTKVGFFDPMSGADNTIFKSSVDNPDIHGFVFVGFGAGNIPSIYHDTIKLATRKHKPVVVVTQCPKGSADMGIYETSAIPLQNGAISGGDMTMQAAIQKLMYGLGKAVRKGIKPSDLVEYIRNYIIHIDYAHEIDPHSVNPKA